MHYHILNLGAGVQSTTLAILAAQGRLTIADHDVTINAAIFADTEEEPVDDGHSVYAHLDWLERYIQTQERPFPIIRRSKGKLGDHLVNGINSTGGRFVSIPAFTLKPNGKEGKVRRQCTREYKIEVIERTIRRDILGLEPRKRIPKDVHVHHYIGISVDEAGRMKKAQKRQEEKPIRWATFHYPLITELGWVRGDCRKFLEKIVPHRVPRSACTFCPFHSNTEWQKIKDRNGEDWRRVVEIDRALRIPGNVFNRNLDQQLFLHRECRPIDQIDFTRAKDDREMAAECEGMCGN